jgi:hypothetical protein
MYILNPIYKIKQAKNVCDIIYSTGISSIHPEKIKTIIFLLAGK